MTQRIIATRGIGPPTVTLVRPCPTWMQDMRLRNLVLVSDPFQTQPKKGVINVKA